MQANNEKTFKCLNCGKETISKRNNIFCSNECYLEFRKRPNQIIEKEQYAEIIIRSMKYGTKHIVIDLEDAEKCKNYKWFLSFDEILNSFYVKTSKYPYSLHRVIMDCPKGFVVDHINHNTLDNRKENLRICTHAENMKNRKRVRECVNCIDLKRQNEKLQKENEELTTINARLLGRLEVDETDTSLVFNLDKELRQKEKEFYTAIKKVVKLKQTLTEIKEIAENVIKNVSERCIKTTPMYGVHKQILNKISEVE